MWEEMDFRIREMLPSDYTQFDETPVLSPGADVTLQHSGQHRTLAIGILLHCPEASKSLCRFRKSSA